MRLNKFLREEGNENKIILVPCRGLEVRTEVSSSEFLVKAENS